jgi:hypothetical protein
MGHRSTAAASWTARRLFGALLIIGAALQACAQSGSSINQISLQRTACFGACPIYTVSIYPDGLVEFHGERFVQSLGDFSARVDPANFTELANFADRLGFFELEEEYRVRREPDGSVVAVSDLPSRITTLVREDRTKSVLNYFAGPDELERFELLIDELTNSARWIGRPTAPSF